MESKFDQMTRFRDVETMVVFALFFIFLGISFHTQVFVYLAIACLLVVFVPPLNRIIAVGWWKLSLLLSAVNNRIILTIIFYLVLTPIACLYRLFNKDPLGLTRKESGSYYYERNHTYTRTDLEKLW